MSILFRHGRHAAPSGGPMFDLPELAHEPATEAITVVTAGASPDDTQMFPAPVKDATFMLPVRRMARLRQAHVPPVLATGHTAIHITGRTLIGDSIRDEHGRFMLTCRHCRASYADTAAGTFRALRDSARDAGWRQDLFGSWACARDVRSNPLFIPETAPAPNKHTGSPGKAADNCQKCGAAIWPENGQWVGTSGQPYCSGRRAA